LIDPYSRRRYLTGEFMTLANVVAGEYLREAPRAGQGAGCGPDFQGA
jgi:hypothetical protein